MGYRRALGLLLLVVAHAVLARSPDLPQTLRFCGQNCFVLTRNGDHYDAVREDTVDHKVLSTYTITRFSADAVVIERDDSGAQQATLTGRLSNEGTSIVGGRATWRSGPFKGQSFAFQMSWGDALAQAKSASQLAAEAALTVERQRREALAARAAAHPPPPPPAHLRNNPALANLPLVMHFCEGYGPMSACMTLELRDGRYVSTSANRYDPPGFQSVWAFDEFSPRSVVIRRHDPPNPGNIDGAWDRDITYRAQLSLEGTRLVNVTANGYASPLQVSWGAALGETPGDNEERDRADTEKRRIEWQAAQQKRRANEIALAMPVRSACEKKPDVQPIGASSVRDLPLIAICECEMDDCPGAAAGLWMLDGSTGTATWSNLATIADLTVERFDRDQVVIKRRNATSSQPGLTAVYTGAMRGNEIDGEVVYTWPGFQGGVLRRRWHGFIANADESTRLREMQKQLVQAIVQGRWQGMLDAAALFGTAVQAGTGPEAQRQQEESFRRVDQIRAQKAREKRE